MSAPTSPEQTFLALLCVELLHMPEAPDASELDMQSISARFQEQLAERLATLDGAVVEREYQNMVFIAFSHHANPVDELESALSFVLQLYRKPLPVLRANRSLSLRFGLSLEELNQRNPMASAAERSLAGASQIVVSQRVLQVIGQTRYPFEPLVVDNPMARQGQYFVLTLQALKAEAMASMSFTQVDADPSPRHATSEEDGFADFSVEDHSPYTVYTTEALPTGVTVALPPAEQATPLALSVESVLPPSPSLSSLSPAVLEQSVSDLGDLPVETEAPTLRRDAFDIFSTPQGLLEDPFVLSVAESRPSSLDARPEQNLPSEEKMPVAYYSPRLHIFDEAPSWPHLDERPLWVPAEAIPTTLYTLNGLQDFLPLFLAKGLGVYQDDYPTTQQVFCLLGETGSGTTSSIMTARQHLDAFLKEGQAASEEGLSPAMEDGVEPPYLSLHTSHYRHQSAYPFYLELWHDLCRALFQIPTEGFLQSQIQSAIEGVLFYIVPETQQALAQPYIQTLTRFMGGTGAEPSLDLIEALAWVLPQVATVKPLLLQLENLETADEASLYVLGVLLHQYGLASHKGMVWVLQSAPSHHLACLEYIDPIYYSTGRLNALNPAESEDYLKSTWLAGCFHTCPTSFIQGLIQRGEGKPFYLEEALRYALQCRLLESNPQTGMMEWAGGNDEQTFAWPESMTVLWYERLQVLPEETAKVLQLAGILGIRFSMLSVASLLGLEQDVLNQHLGVLWEQGWILPDVADSVSFRHPLLLKAVRQFMPADELSHRHAWVYESLSQHFEAPVAMPEPVLAFHAFYGALPEALAHQNQAWQERIEPFTASWLPSFLRRLQLQDVDLDLKTRLSLWHAHLQAEPDPQAEKSLLKCEAYEALQMGRLTLATSVTFEMLILLGDDAKEQLDLKNAQRLYEYARDIHQESALNAHGDFIAMTSLMVLAWMRYDLLDLQSGWKRLEHHPAWKEPSTALVPWKLEAIGLALHLYRLQANSPAVKKWYTQAKHLWELCIRDALNPLWMARSQLAYAHYLYDKGALHAYRQITENVKLVLASTPTQSVALHQTLVDYVMVNWLEDHHHRLQSTVQERYQYLADDLEANRHQFTPHHRRVLETLVASMRHPQKSDDYLSQMRRLGLGLVADALAWQKIEEALMSRQVDSIQHALEDWQFNLTGDVLPHFELLTWQATMVRVRILILEQAFVPALQLISTVWKPLASSLMGRVLVMTLALLAHIYHRVAYEAGMGLAQQDAYVKKSRGFAEQALALSVQSQNPTLQADAETLMKFG